MDDHFTIETADHHRNLFLELHKLQQHRVACDVAIVAEEGEISAHRIILMSASKYFREKIMAAKHETNLKLYLHGVTIAELANIIKYIYSGKLFITKDSIDMTLNICEMLKLNEVIDAYKDKLAKGAAQENVEIKVDVTSDSSAMEDSLCSSQTSTQAICSDGINKKKKDPRCKRNVQESVIDLSRDYDEVVIKSEVDNECLTENPDGQKKSCPSSCLFAPEMDNSNIVSKDVIPNSYIPAIQKHKSTKNQNVEHKGFTTTATKAKLRTKLDGASGSKRSSSPTSSLTNPPVPSQKRHSISVLRSEKQKFGETILENQAHRNVVPGGALLHPGNLTEEHRGSSVFSTKGKEPFQYRRELMPDTPSQVTTSPLPQDSLAVENRKHADDSNKQSQVTSVFSGTVPTVGHPTPKTVFTHAPVSSSATVITPRLSSKYGQSAHYSVDKQERKPAFPINVLRNISNIKGAILTAPISEDSSKKQTPGDHLSVDIYKNTKPPNLDSSVNSKATLENNLKNVTASRLKERAQEGLSNLSQKFRQANKTGISESKPVIHSSVIEPNQQIKPLNIGKGKDVNHTKESYSDLVEIVDTGSDTINYNLKTETPNSCNSGEYMYEYISRDKSSNKSLQSQCNTEDKEHDSALDKVKNVSLSDSKDLNETESVRKYFEPLVDSTPVVKLNRISDQELVRWTKRKLTATDHAAKSTTNEVNTKDSGSSETPAKTRRLSETDIQSSTRSVGDVSKYQPYAHVKFTHDDRYTHPCPISGCRFSATSKSHLDSHQKINHSSSKHNQDGVLMSGRRAGRPNTVKEAVVTLNKYKIGYDISCRNKGTKMKYKDFVALTETKPSGPNLNREGHLEGKGIIKETTASENRGHFNSESGHGGLAKTVMVTMNKTNKTVDAAKPAVTDVIHTVKNCETFVDQTKATTSVGELPRAKTNALSPTNLNDSGSLKTFENVDEVIDLTTTVVECVNDTIDDEDFPHFVIDNSNSMEANITDQVKKRTEKCATETINVEPLMEIHELPTNTSLPSTNIVGRRRGRPTKASLENSDDQTACEPQQSHARLRTLVPGDYVIPDMEVLLQSNYVSFDR